MKPSLELCCCLFNLILITSIGGKESYSIVSSVVSPGQDYKLSAHLARGTLFTIEETFSRYFYCLYKSDNKLIY